MTPAEVVIAGGAAIGSATAFSLADRITGGRFTSLDLSPLGFDRIIRGAPFPEHAVI